MAFPDEILGVADPREALRRDGAVVIHEFLNGADTAELRSITDAVYRELTACTVFGNADLESNFRGWNGVWLEELPAFLSSRNPDLLTRFDRIRAQTAEQIRKLFGPDWRPYPERSFLRRHMGVALLVPWHLDADAAKLGHAQCFNVWLPTESVGRALPSLQIARGSHRTMRTTPPREERPAIVATFGKPWTPQLDAGDALVFDQFTLHRTQPIGTPDMIRTSCEFRFYRSPP